MASHSPTEMPLEQGQRNPTAPISQPEQQGGSDQPHIRPKFRETFDQSDEHEEEIELKPAQREKTAWMYQKERTTAWVETQIAPDPVAPISETIPIRNPPKQTETEQSTVIRKSLVVGTPKTPGRKTTRRTPITDRRPINMIKKGPVLKTKSARSVEGTRRYREAETPSDVYPDISLYSLEIQGEAAFNRGEL